MLAHGASVGYSSPLTLRDDGACDAQGKPAGDLSKLRPTLMAAVPLILDRMRAGIQEQVIKVRHQARSSAHTGAGDVQTTRFRSFFLSPSRSPHTTRFDTPDTSTALN